MYPLLEQDPGTRITMEGFVDRAKALGVDGVSLESCFLPTPTPDEITRLRNQLDRLELDRVWAWGHPGGLHSGAVPEECIAGPSIRMTADRMDALAPKVIECAKAMAIASRSSPLFARG